MLAPASGPLLRPHQLAYLASAIISLAVLSGCKDAPAPEAIPERAKQVTAANSGDHSGLNNPAQGTPKPTETSETAPFDIDDKRRNRRGIETAGSAPAKNLFADAPAPPVIRQPADTTKALVGPAKVALADGTPVPSKAGLLAAHLKTVRKLRAGILPDPNDVFFYDLGVLRETTKRKALLSGPGMWATAAIVGAAIPPLSAVTVDGGLGIVVLSVTGASKDTQAWRVTYEYRGNRWRWTQLWRDPR